MEAWLVVVQFVHHIEDAIDGIEELPVEVGKLIEKTNGKFKFHVSSEVVASDC